MSFDSTKTVFEQAKDDDLFGLSVTLAARIGDWGEPGQVLVSDVVRQLLLGKGFEFTSVGEAELKGLDGAGVVVRSGRAVTTNLRRLLLTWVGDLDA